MPLEIVKKRTMPIGVDLGSSRVKMAQLQTGAEGLELLAAEAADIPLDDEPAFRDRLSHYTNAIRRILRRGRFKGRRCIISIPARDVVVQHVKIPQLPPEQSKAAVRTEIQEKLPYPVETAVIREIFAGEVRFEGELRREMIVVATARATVEAYLAAIRRTRLDPIAANVEACAIVECFARLFRRATDAARTVLFIDLGATSTQAVFSQGGKVVFARNLPMGTSDLDHLVAEKLGISLGQARQMRLNVQNLDQHDRARRELYALLEGELDGMADQLTPCLRYYESVFRNETIERVVFVGGGALDTSLCQGLARRLNLPAQVGDPFVQIRRRAPASGPTGSPSRQKPQPDWAVAIGLTIGAGAAA